MKYVLVNWIITRLILLPRETMKKINYPKYVLLADEYAGGNYEGIQTIHIADFLLNSSLWSKNKSKPLWYYTDHIMACFYISYICERAA